MRNEPSEERLARIIRLYETEAIPTKDKIIHLHFFICGSDWYLSEFDGEDLFFGYAILNGDQQNAEWGYSSFSDIKFMNVDCIEIDCELEEFWIPKPVPEIPTIKVMEGKL